MNGPQRLELERLKRRQNELTNEVAALAKQIANFESRAASPPPLSHPDVPPLIQTDLAPPAIAPVELIIPTKPAPPVIEPLAKAADSITKPAPAITEEFIPEFRRNKERASHSTTPAATPPPLSSGPEKPAAPEGSFEMQLGTYWLVRVGAVMILTGLVFFGNLAYQKLGAGGKVALLYLASGLLLGAGAWWQRKNVKESLQNFAQVLFAGGLAAVYFTTYAAHHIATLRVISSAWLDGALLLGWAGYIAWIADRRKSELLALFATGLAYYTSVITPVGGFTLYSNLVLTITAVIFLVRNRWAGLSWASLVATYAAYAWWRFYHGGEGWRWATADEGLGFGASFLFSYWLVFTVAAFLSKHENIAGIRRASFITINNGALFSLFVLTMLQVDTERFWQFSLGYGSALLVLAELARRFLPGEMVTKNTYLTQGLMLVTIGLVSKFTGTQLALVLAAESVILFILGTLRKNIFLQTGAYISGAMSVGWGIDCLERDSFSRLVLGAALGGLMALNGCWSARRRWWADRRELRPEPTYFILLALTMWIATTWFNTTTATFPIALGVETVLLTATIYFLRVRELALMGQLLLLLAHAGWLARFADPLREPAWWNPLALIIITLGLSQWWQHQRTINIRPAAAKLFQMLYAAGIVIMTHTWLAPKFTPATWLITTSGLALFTTAYAARTKLWPLAAAAQIFLLESSIEFVRQLATTKPLWYFPLAPIAALALLSFATWLWFSRQPESQPSSRTTLLSIATIYRWVALAMTIGWVHQYIDLAERPWVFGLLGLAAFAMAGWRREREAILFSTVLTVTGFVTLWLLPTRETLVYFPNALFTLTLLVQQQIASRKPERYELPAGAQHAMILTGCVTLWWLLSQWILLRASSLYLTASWSAFAFGLIGSGVMLREKLYRWVGLGILAIALGRIVIFDVWRLETFYRVLSFMALGLVLVALGFIYNKYQEKIREWL